jgi:NAD(P)-dependent dehydrogenase (short-subunit alcohol dehydrogenase family)
MDLLVMKNNEKIANECKVFFEGPFSFVHSVGDLWDHIPFTDVSTERARNIMDSHYGTLYAVLQSVLPLMIKKGGGKIVAYSCNAVNYNFPNMLPFNAAKAAVEATIKCIAHEYSNQNIVANVLALSSLQTDAVKKSKPHGDYEHYLPLNEICETTLDILNLNNNLVNASVINCYKYSDSYYNKGYFERIKK